MTYAIIEPHVESGFIQKHYLRHCCLSNAFDADTTLGVAFCNVETVEYETLDS